MGSGQADPFDKLTLNQKFGCGLSIMAMVMAWIIGRIVILADGSSAPHPNIGQIYPVELGRFEPRRTVYLDVLHLTLSWALQAPLYAFVVGCIGYTFYNFGRRVLNRPK